MYPFQFLWNKLSGIIGRNGAGKTTLFNIIAGQLNPTEGTVRIDTLNLLKNHQWIKRNLSYCPQTFIFYEYLSIRENLELAGHLFNIEKKDLIQRINNLLLEFELIEGSSKL